MESHTVQCPNCSALIPPDNINIMALLAKCASCGHLVQLNALSPNTGWNGDHLPDAIPSCPSGITHDQESGTGVWLRRRWFSPGLFFLLFFCIAWDAFLVVWYSIALVADKKPAGGDFWIMFLFPIGHVAVGVGLTYYTIAGFLNSTFIQADEFDLRIRHRPIPWFGNRTIPVDAIQAIELNSGWTKNNQPMLAVCAHHIDGRQVTLLSGLPDDHARYIAWVLSDALQVPLNRKI